MGHRHSRWRETLNCGLMWASFNHNVGFNARARFSAIGVFFAPSKSWGNVPRAFLGKKCDHSTHSLARPLTPPAMDGDESPCLPVFSIDADAAILLDFYQKHQILHVRATGSSTTSGAAAVQELRKLWATHAAKIEKHWSVENAGTSAGSDEVRPAAVLGADPPTSSYYVSTILQSPDGQLQQTFLSNACPHAVPPFFTAGKPRRHPSSSSSPSLEGPWGPVTHSAPVWVFLGSHPRPMGAAAGRKKGGRTHQPGEPLVGRPEHTDAVSHSGTWHYQVRGGCYFL